jgi:hypothetical protein
MHGSQTTTGYTQAERSRIIKDIAQWKCELEIDQEFTHSELTNYVEELRKCDDDTLESFWEDTVGEWVASRTDLNIPPNRDFDSWLDSQFERLISGHQTDYGFIIEIDIGSIGS